MSTDKTTKKYHKFVLIASTFTLLGLILIACSSPKTVATVPAGAKPGELTLEPCTFKMDEAEYEADCGTLVVPENRAKADSRLIALPVIRVRATGNNPAEPVFWLQGGPGDSNMELKPAAWLLARHDFVMVGYRGADGSSVLECPEYDRMLRSPSPGGDALGAESLAETAKAMAECAARLQAAGVDLEGYTIPDVVEDMEAARMALNYERVNLLSASYGTRVAQMYAYLHPDRVYRSVMSGASPPGASSLNRRRWMHNWDTSPACVRKTPSAAPGPPTWQKPCAMWPTTCRAAGCSCRLTRATSRWPPFSCSLVAAQPPWPSTPTSPRNKGTRAGWR
jgi:pimeloyl-ACP methyl ester carboxylesterase